MRYLSLLLFLFILASCSNNANKDSENDSTRLRELSADTSASIMELAPEQLYVWEVNSDNKTISRNPDFKDSYLSVDTILTGLNAMYPKVKLEKLRMGHDTLYTAIKDANYLTEQMGSAGSENYIAQAVINLTSVSGVNFVRMDFEMGSHASPDVWSKQDFKDYKVVAAQTQ